MHSLPFTITWNIPGSWFCPKFVTVPERTISGSRETLPSSLLNVKSQSTGAVAGSLVMMNAPVNGSSFGVCDGVGEIRGDVSGDVWGEASRIWVGETPGQRDMDGTVV